MDNIITSKSREVKHCPPHFIKVPVEFKRPGGLSLTMLPDLQHTPENKIRNWLHENIEHRFFIGDCIDTASESTMAKRSAGLTGVHQSVIIESFVVAFEVAADATYFSLLLPSFLD
jgi:hypothetical protein